MSLMEERQFKWRDLRLVRLKDVCLCEKVRTQAKYGRNGLQKD